jgi:hypothetical protein
MWGKKQWEIVNASKRGTKAVYVEDRCIKLDKQGKAMIYDEGLAQEVDARYGVKAKTRHAGDVVVIPVDDRNPTREQGHQYSFTMPDMSRFKGWSESHEV